MTNTSSTTAGYLVPLLPDAVEGDPLEDALSAMISALTRIDNAYVNVAYQDEGPYQAAQPQRPDPSVTWVSFTIREGETLGSRSSELHVGAQPGDNGVLVVQQVERTDILASFYGPDANLRARLLREGLMVEQNRWPLRALGLGLREVGKLTSVPELSAETNYRAQRRWDVPLSYMRATPRTYGVEDLSALSKVKVVEG